MYREGRPESSEWRDPGKPRYVLWCCDGDVDPTGRGCPLQRLLPAHPWTRLWTHGLPITSSWAASPIRMARGPRLAPGLPMVLVFLFPRVPPPATTSLSIMLSFFLLSLPPVPQKPVPLCGSHEKTFFFFFFCWILVRLCHRCSLEALAAIHRLSEYIWSLADGTIMMSYIMSMYAPKALPFFHVAAMLLYFLTFSTYLLTYKANGK